MYRLILCCNCKNWKNAENVELGTCCLEQAGKIVENTTYYDSRCIYGISENIEKDINDFED
jgi:hypothetical protein